MAKKKTVKRAMGRPTEYDPKYRHLAKRLALLGGTDKQLAELLGVSEVTINAWKKKYPDFLKSLNAGKDIADTKVARALYQRALGYSHPEDKFFQFDGKIITQRTTKHYPPDPTSMIFWLKNRQTGKWRDKQEHEHSGAVGTFQLQVTPEESTV